MMLVRDNKGNLGHARLIKSNKRNDIIVEHYEIRMFDDYKHVSVYGVSSFFIYYEVLDEVED